MNAKAIAITIAFAVLAIILNPIRIPAVVLPGFYHRIYEIPIVIAFLLFGPKIGISVGILHLICQIVFFPVPLGDIAYPFGLAAVLNMMLGVYLANLLIMHRVFGRKALAGNRRLIYLTVFGTLSRGVISPILDYAILYHLLIPLALGLSIPEAYILSLVPGMIMFNVTVPLYTIPLSYLIARKVNKRFNIVNMNKIMDLDFNCS